MPYVFADYGNLITVTSRNDANAAVLFFNGTASWALAKLSRFNHPLQALQQNAPGNRQRPVPFLVAVLFLPLQACDAIRSVLCRLVAPFFVQIDPLAS